MTRISNRRRRWIGVLVAAALFYVFVWPPLFDAWRYPTVVYSDEIHAVAAEFRLPPPLIAAIVCTESHFVSNARSSAGACGLMQIMPSTGAWIAQHLGLPDPGATGLQAPLTNLRFGGWYLRFLLDRYGGAVELAVAAYHAGHNAVDRWLANPDYSSDGRSLARYPQDAPRTSRYVNKVKGAYEYYQKTMD